jgi:26S proteasome regulatory subunit T5
MSTRNRCSLEIELAKEKAPAIIFIDELDAIGTKRFDSDKSGDREVQRTMLELLNQLDGFSSDERIKVSFLDPDYRCEGN